jgi:hypothetical protein
VIFSVPTIVQSVAQFLISPEYTCEIELKQCDTQWYTRDTVDAYAQRVLATKPESIADDNYLNSLYASMPSGGKTISIV